MFDEAVFVEKRDVVLMIEDATLDALTAITQMFDEARYVETRLEVLTEKAEILRDQEICDTSIHDIEIP